MKRKWTKVICTAGMLVASFWLVVGQVSLTGCIAPVSDEATVSVQGRVLDVDGTPMTDVTVRLVKTDYNVLGADWVIGWIANEDKSPFREIETDANGEFYFEFEGADANAENQAWAAYFVAYVLHPDDPDRHMGVATDTFQFSNQTLHKELPDLHFWDLPEGGVTVTDETVEITFDATSIAPEKGVYIVHVEGTEWTAEVEGTEYSLPLSALEPCQAPVKDSPDECVPKTEHKLQIVSLADGLRYRTAWHSFTATNPKGMGLWYRNPDDNSAGNTCSGKLLFDINDGKFSGTNAVQLQDAGMTKEDFRCLLIDLRDDVMVDEIFVANAAVWSHQNARVRFSIAATAEPVDEDWTELVTWLGEEHVYPMMSLHIPEIAAPARWLKVEFLDVGEKAFWQRIGEIVVYGATMEPPAK